MIKNIIFDIGGVLTRFDPNYGLGSFSFTEEKSKILTQAIFKNSFFKQLIAGNISTKEFTREILQAKPKYKKDIKYILHKKNQHKILPPLKEGIDYLKELKGRGYKIYILSNIIESSIKYFLSNFRDVVENLDGSMYSCREHVYKPSEEAYIAFLNKYNLTPDECIFIDDTEKNVITANKLGMHGVWCVPVKYENEFKKVDEVLLSINNN